MKPTWKKISVAAGCFILLGLCLFVTHWRAKAAAEKLKVELRARGEKLSIEELIPPSPPADSNAAPTLLNALAHLSGFDSKLLPAAMRPVAPGSARIAWTQPVLPSNEATNIWSALRPMLESNAGPLAELRQALAGPAVRFPVQYQQGTANLLPHLGKVRAGSQWLSAAALLAMHEQRTAEAWENLRALIALPERWSDEPMMISQFVRCAIVAQAGNSTWEALQYPHWSDEQLKELQSIWSSMDLLSQLEPSLEMERAFFLALYPGCRASLDRLDSALSGGAAAAGIDWSDLGEQMLTNPGEAFDVIMERLPRRWIWKWWDSYWDEIWMVRRHQLHLQAVRRAKGQPAFVPLEQQLRVALDDLGEPSRQFLLARGLGGSYAISYMRRLFTAESQRRIVVTAIALCRFERQRGSSPVDLSALVPEFLPAVPLDPMDGQPLRYLKAKGGRLVPYSIGDDGVDGGGNSGPGDAPAEGAGPPNYYWMRCPDWVWPSPASDEQVIEYHSKLEQERKKRRK